MNVTREARRHSANALHVTETTLTCLPSGKFLHVCFSMLKSGVPYFGKVPLIALFNVNASYPLLLTATCVELAFYRNYPLTFLSEHVLMLDCKHLED